MIGKNHENDLISLLETLKETKELWIRYDFSWFEATLEYGRVPVSEGCG